MKNKKKYEAEINLLNDNNELIETRYWIGNVFNIKEALIKLDEYYKKLHLSFNKKEIIYCKSI